MAKGNKIVTVRVADAMHKRMRIRTAEEGIDSFQSLLTSLIQQWLDNAGEPEVTAAQMGESSRGLAHVAVPDDTAYPESTEINEYAAEVAMFTRILRDGPPVVRRAILENVRAFDALRGMVAAHHECSKPEPERRADAEAIFSRLIEGIEQDHLAAAERSRGARKLHRGRKAG